MCECPACGESFATMDALVDHRTDAHDAYTQVTSSGGQCDE